LSNPKSAIIALINELENLNIMRHYEISENIIQIVYDNLDNPKMSQKTRYFIFEPSDIYTSIQAMMQFQEEINEFSKMNIDASLVKRLPFFGGITSKELSVFMDLNVTLEKPINFSVVPADFNFYGIKRFCNYIGLKHSEMPAYGSNDNFSDYVSYFIEEIKNNDWKINSILPTGFLSLCGDNNGMHALFIAIQEAKKETE